MGAIHFVDIVNILKIICIFLTILLITNLGDLFIYYSNFLARKYPTLIKPTYYDNFLKDVSEVSGGKRAFF